MEIRLLLFAIIIFSSFSFSQKSNILYDKVRITSSLNEIDSSYSYSVSYISKTSDIDSLVGFFIDTDLDNIRNSRFGVEIEALLIEKYRQTYPQITEPLLGFKLWKLGVEDQKTRSLNYFIRDSSLLFKNKDSLKLRKIESENYVMEQLRLHKGLTNSIVGNHGAKGAFLIIQHAGNKKYLKIYTRVLWKNKGDVNPRFYAQMRDRLLLSRGRKQRYGTQTNGISGYVENGIFITTSVAALGPINGSEKRINKRRKKIGLGELKDDYIWELINKINQ